MLGGLKKPRKLVVYKIVICKDRVIRVFLLRDELKRGFLWPKCGHTSSPKTPGYIKETNSPLPHAHTNQRDSSHVQLQGVRFVTLWIARVDVDRRVRAVTYVQQKLQHIFQVFSVIWVSRFSNIWVSNFSSRQI
jgi:hypothetical protein